MVPLHVRVKVEEKERVGRDEPVSPTGQYFNSSVLSVAILVVFEFDIPIDDSPTMSTLENLFLPINPRFSSIMVRDAQGVQQWRRVKVNLEEHVHVPTFPSGLDTYDEYVQDYISKIAATQLPQSRPLWDLHLIKFPTSKAEGTMVFRIHHSLGDGYSLMSAIFNCLQRADDPSLPLTFPSGSKPKPTKNGMMMGIISRLPSAISLCVNTVRDFGWSVLKSNLVEDDKSPVRSGTPGVEFLPITLSSIDFSIDDLHKIKTKIGGTINDVICGIAFLGIRLYNEAASEEATAKAANMTALVLLNTRDIRSYQPLNEMTKSDTKSPWGNHFAFIHVGIPSCKDPMNADPLQFVQTTKKIIQEKKNSLAVVLTAKFVEIIRRLKGSEAASKYVHATMRNTSVLITNMVGPMEQMSIAGHPIRNFYFTLAGSPQSITLGIVSYMGKLNLAMGVDEGLIDPKLLTSCMEKSFERISQAAIGMKP